MCKCFEQCRDCPLGNIQGPFVFCRDWINDHPKEAEKIILNWSIENPVTTNRMKLKEVFGFFVFSLFKGTLKLGSCMSQTAQMIYIYQLVVQIHIDIESIRLEVGNLGKSRQHIFVFCISDILFTKPLIFLALSLRYYLTGICSSFILTIARLLLCSI